MLRLELTGDDTTLVLTLTNALRGPRGLDTELTEQDRIATGQDRVQTGLDRTATGEGRQAAAQSAQTATDQAEIATTKADAATVASAGAQSFFNRLYLGGY